MKTLVMKFGGASVAGHEHFPLIADLILQRTSDYRHIVVVVSAMGDTTDQLIALAKKINPNAPSREYDMLLTAGERVSMSLLAMALALKEQEAYSFTGSQAGIITCDRHTNARIIDVRPHRILPHLSAGRIVIVAGFQGVSRAGEITTLGRGGSDTSAVALAAALQADRVEFFKDVAGIFTEDPKLNPNASLIEQLTYDGALEIAKKGAEILHPRCIFLAKKNAPLPLYVRSFSTSENDSYAKGTWIQEETSTKKALPTYEEDETSISETLAHA